jgi:glycosyltransferase involved in cell wall biosynthesis
MGGTGHALRRQPDADTAHVLMTADAVGGVWTHAVDLAGGLLAAGWRVTLAVPGPAPRPRQVADLAAEAPGCALLPLQGPLDWQATSPEHAATAAEALLALARRLRPDVLHVHAPAMLLPGAPYPCPTVAVTHSCVATWFAAVHPGAALPETLAWQQRLTAAGLAAADANVVPTAAFGRAMQAAYGQDLRFTVIENGRAEAPVPAAPVAPAGVFTAGRLWDAAKNVAVLDRAARLLAVPVHAAGPLALAGEQPIALAHLRPLGVLSAEDMRQRLAGQPIFVSPALYEPFGLTVLEAAQAGCPLVLSRIATFEELWHGAALFVDPHSPQEIATAVQVLCANPARRRQLGERARERAAQWSLACMVSRYLNLYAVMAPDAMRRESLAS